MMSLRQEIQFGIRPGDPLTYIGIPVTKPLTGYPLWIYQ